MSPLPKDGHGPGRPGRKMSERPRGNQNQPRHSAGSGWVGLALALAVEEAAVWTDRTLAGEDAGECVAARWQARGARPGQWGHKGYEPGSSVDGPGLVTCSATKRFFVTVSEDSSIRPTPGFYLHSLEEKL